MLVLKAFWAGSLKISSETKLGGRFGYSIFVFCSGEGKGESVAPVGFLLRSPGP